MKKLGPALVVGAIAVAAYSQARGLSFLVAAQLNATTPSTPHIDAPVAEPSPATTDPTPILERNPFDSETGPLHDHIAIEAHPPEPAIAIEADSPACAFGEVTLIVATDPEYSFASITTPSASQLYKVGDTIDGRTVRGISWDRVSFAGTDGACHIKLGDKIARKASPSPKKKAKKKKKKRGKKEPTPVPEHIAKRIRKLGPNRYAIDRSAFDEVFAMENGLVRGTRVRPVKEGDEVIGMSFNGRGVADGSLLHSIGIRAGDVLKTVNGFQPTNAQKALEAYGRLRTADSLTLVLDRKGTPMTIEYEIQ